MRILHVYRTYFPDSQGGLEEVIRQICLNSRRYGVESRVFTLSHHPVPAIVERPEAAVHRAKKTLELASCGISASAFHAYKKQVEWADLIHYHFPWPFADFLHFMAGVKKPSVITYHSDIVRQRVLGRLYEPLMNRFLGDVDRIIGTSPNYFATSNVLSKFSRKVEIIPIGLNENSYPSPSDAQTAGVKSQYGENFFLFVGVLRYYKGLHILLDAIKDAPYRVVIVGSGPTETELHEQANRLQLDNVTFAGSVDDLTKVSLFKICRGVVFPSYLRSEAFGVTLLEGAIYGKPLISTEVGSGTSHVNIHNETGFVVTPGSAQELRAAMNRLHASPEIAHLLGERARKRFELLFTGALMGARYTGVYRELTNSTEGIPLIELNERKVGTLQTAEKTSKTRPRAQR